MTAQTRFAPVKNIFTGVDVIRVVPAPDIPSKRKGTTQHDDKFDKLLDFKQALQIPEYEFNSIRRSLQRYMANNGINKTVSVRQLKDYKTKSYTLWLVDKPPKGAK